MAGHSAVLLGLAFFVAVASTSAQQGVGVGGVQQPLHQPPQQALQPQGGPPLAPQRTQPLGLPSVPGAKPGDAVPVVPVIPFESVDSNGDDLITRDEFQAYTDGRVPGAPRVSYETLQKIASVRGSRCAARVEYRSCLRVLLSLFSRNNHT